MRFATRLALPLLALTACMPFAPGDRMDLPSGSPPVDRGLATDDALADAVDAAALDFLGSDRAPGLAIAVVADGQVLFAAGYGWADIEAERRMTAHTPILLSSVSKTFIGVAAMQATANDTLTLDDPVDDLVGFRVDNPKVDGETITLRHALTHNTGIRDTREYARAYDVGDPTIELPEFVRGYVTGGGDYYRRRNWTRDRPGSSFRYSNVGASLAALAIAEAQDTTFDDLVRKDLLEPLAMNDSAYRLEDLPAEPAVPYKSTLRNRYRPWPQYGYPTYPDGMMRSSAHDMGRYLAAIVGDGELDGVRILDADSVDTMLTVDPSAGTDEDGQAVAWAMRRAAGRELFGHNGGDFGSTTEIWIDREADVGIAVLLNGDVDGDAWDDLMDLEAEILDLAEAATAEQ